MVWDLGSGVYIRDARSVIQWCGIARDRNPQSESIHRRIYRPARCTDRYTTASRGQ